MTGKERRARITSWYNDGEFVTISYIQEDGQRVKADFKRGCWKRAPRSFLEKVKKALSQGPLQFIGPKAG